MYYSLLRLVLPKRVKLVVHADDVGVEKYLDEINLAFQITFESINQWTNTVNLQLAKPRPRIPRIMKESRVSITSIALIVSNAFRTVSEEAVYVVARILPIELLDSELRNGSTVYVDDKRNGISQ
ncbi:hypothetical protein EVAR_82087_1 [Eumeta japonica]|uniref:Uncharacterized protein n=1 Tax=Eumeta variegata TaxID=151549 RepID=A0A4C1U2C9_EUMVA|nr:hypothetical protein EVAR_82087_1 [Eumeta japonica]